MPRKLPKYVIEDKTDGVFRFYFRKLGQAKIRLHGVPGSDEFNKEYYEAFNSLAKPELKGPKMSTKGSLRWLCEHYFQSADYKKLDARTRLVRKQIIEHMWAEPTKPGSERMFEDMPLTAFSAKGVRVLRDRKADLPEAANSRLKALRAVFKWATSPGVEKVTTNPVRDVPYFKNESDGFHTWTEEELDKYETRHPIGTKARLAMALMLYTSQRRSDAILLGRQHISNGAFKFTQFKGRKKKPITLEIPIHPELQKVIDGTKCGEMTLLMTEFNKPFTANGFGGYFRRRCDEAELFHCSAHGLRKVAATRMAEHGASEKQIMSITGHTTMKEVARYTKAASQKRLARGSIDMLSKMKDDDE